MTLLVNFMTIQVNQSVTGIYMLKNRFDAHQIILFRTLSICANTDNTLFVTKVGFVPKSFAPKTTGNTTAVANVAMTLLLLPTITIIPESKVRYNCIKKNLM